MGGDARGSWRGLDGGCGANAGQLKPPQVLRLEGREMSQLRSHPNPYDEISRKPCCFWCSYYCICS